jgi:hypothetical protein
VRLKDGTPSAGKRILIDGQQRVTALMAALLGREVLTKDYETVRIRIAFHPLEGGSKSPIPPSARTRPGSPTSPPSSCLRPSSCSSPRHMPPLIRASMRTRSSARSRSSKNIVNNHVGLIELAEDLDIETVTEIFIRVNSAGATLNQADFAMSKIAANETYGGNQLRKAIDYFCHLAVAPEFHGRIAHNDPRFAASEYFPKMTWLKDVNDDIHDSTYTDMLRVAFTSEFRRGKLQDLVALLSWRDFETKQYEETVAEQAFAQLRQGVHSFINQTHFERFMMILRSAGFVSKSLIGGQNAVNFAYIIYLRGRADGLSPAEIERVVRRWYVAATLTGRYAGNPETTFDFDIRQIESRGLRAYTSTD